MKNSLFEKGFVLIVAVLLLPVIPFVGTSPGDAQKIRVHPTSPPFIESWRCFCCRGNTLYGHNHVIGYSPNNVTLNGATWIQNQAYPWWVVEYHVNGSAIWKIDEEGLYSQVTRNCGAPIRDLSHDSLHDELYGVVGASPGNGSLYTIDLGTGDAGYIGNIPKSIYDIAIDEDGQAYGHTLQFSGGSYLYKINLENASATLIGSMGVNFCYAPHELEFDQQDTPNLLYLIGYYYPDLIGYYYPASQIGLFTVNTATGYCTLLSIFPQSWPGPDALAISLNTSYPPPNTPVLRGPTNGRTHVPYSFYINTTDPNGYNVYYFVDWGDGHNSGWIGPYQSEATATLNYSWSEAGTYTIKVKAKNIYGSRSNWSNPLTITIVETQPPNPPDKPMGPTSGKPGVTYTYSTRTSDPDGDQVYYMWDWDDGTVSDWLGPFYSGLSVSAQKSWTKKGTYAVKVKAKDTYGHESSWSEPLSVTMPYSYNLPFMQFWMKLLERFPHAFPILRHLMGC